MEEITIMLLVMALITPVIFESVDCHPVPDEKQLYVSTQLHNIDTVKSSQSASSIGDSNTENTTTKMIKRKYTIPKTNLPPSPVGLLRPDTFQFYTFNHNGDVVMKQMSEKEIQTLIASTGGHFPMEIHEPQVIAEISPSETKVADVVQNVQNVLKAELNKPPSVMTSMPTIPGHDNSDWSNILPSILASDMEPEITSKPDYIKDVDIPEEIAPNPTLHPGPDLSKPIKAAAHDTKPMIPVAVITVEPQTASYNNEEEVDGIPIFHIFNTITADTKDSFTHRPNQTSATILQLDQMSGESEPVTPCLLMRVCKNSTIDEIEPGHPSAVEISINGTIKSHETEKPKPSIITSTIESKNDIENSLHFHVLSINENNITMNLEKVTNNSKEPQAQSGNETSVITESDTEKPMFSKASNKTVETTAISEISSISHEMELSHDEMSIIKFNTSMDEQTLVDDSSNQFNESQIFHSITNNRNNVRNKTVIPQSEISEIACCDEISSAPPEFVTQKYPSPAAPSDSLNTFTTVLTDIPQIDETSSSTTIYVQLTTITPISQEIFTSSIQVQSTIEKLNNSNSNKPNDVVVPEEKYSLSTAATPIVSEKTLPSPLSISTDPISNELANSLSSMISQISQMLPSIIPPSNDIHESENATENAEISGEINPRPTKSSETKSEHLSTERNTMNMSAIHDRIEISQNANTSNNSTEMNSNPKLNFESNQKHVDEEKKEINGKIHETPIVRIDIMETIPNIIDKKMNVTPVNRDNDDHPDDDERTESPMVRIKLTDPISTLNHILESSPVQSSTQGEIEIVTLPTNQNVSANGIGSGLIAGFISNTYESTSSKYLEPINDTEANGLVFNETSENIDHVMENVPMVTMNGTTPLPNPKIQTEFENISHTLLSNTSEGNMVTITGLSSFTEGTKTNHSKCSYQNSSEPNDVGNKSLCSANSNIVQESNETGTHANEKYVIKPPHLTTIPPYVSTRLWSEHEMVKQEATTDNVIIPEVLEGKVTDSTENVMTQMPNQTQLDSKLISQSLSGHDPEFSGWKTENSSSNIEHSTELGSQMNHTEEQIFLNLQQELPSSARLPDMMEINYDMKIPNQMKDIKKDDPRIESKEKIETGKLPAISLKLDNISKPVQTFPILNKLNFTQETKSSEKWTLIPQESHFNSHNISAGITNPLEQRIAVIQKESEKSPQTDALSGPKGALGLDSSVGKLDADISYFSILCNDLAFKYWNAVNSGLSTSRSIALSPFGMTSILAMIFLGARSPTSDRMNEVLKLDDVTSFNPHLVFQNVTDSVGIAQNQGMANVAFVRELFADQSKVRKLMRFYKKQAEQFYDGMVEQVNFSTISDAVRRKTNFLIRKQTGGRIRNFVKSNAVPLRSPLAALSANVFQTDCNSNDATSRGRDGELYFAVSPAVRQRKLVLVPATLWKAGVLAGYEPSLDATAYAIGSLDKIVSTIFVIPGQQGSTASDDNLDLLEQRIISGVLHDAAWNKLLKVIVPRPGLELQIPKFSHKSVINATAALKLMGLEELFLQCADFKGINGVGNDFHLADVIQMNLFSTCGDENIQSGKTKHHVEIYPASPQRNARESKHNGNTADTDNLEISKNTSSPLESIEAMTPSSTITITTSKIKNEDKPRVKLDKPFLYFVRHNPTGLILFMGRFNPRLLP